MKHEQTQLKATDFYSAAIIHQGLLYSWRPLFNRAVWSGAVLSGLAISAPPCRIPRADVISLRTVAEVSDRHRQHNLCIGVHNSKCGCPLRYAPLHPHEAYRLYDGGVVYDGPRPRPQSSETTFASVNSSRALTTGAARPSNINLYTLMKAHPSLKPC